MRRTSETEDLLREAAARVLAAVVRRFGDFSDSEDAVQEAMIDAARQWPAQGVPKSPGEAERAERLRSVLRILYLIFNEGYVASSGAELARAELSGEAIRLARIVRLALPADPEVAGLLALMLLTDARRPARSDADGELISLERQDRSLWDRGLTAEGLAVLAEALGRGAVGEYQLQAAIAAEHAKAPRAEDTDWREVPGLYEQLAGHHRLHAVRAHLLEMDGEEDAAIVEYRAAAELTKSLPEQRYLTTQATRLHAGR